MPGGNARGCGTAPGFGARRTVSWFTAERQQFAAGNSAAAGGAPRKPLVPTLIGTLYSYLSLG